MRTRLKSHLEARNTRVKLDSLEKRYEEARRREMSTPELKQITLFSLRRMINQMKEELALFECDLKSGRIPPETVEV